MLIKLNPDAVRQLEMIMKRANFSSPAHCLNKMINQIATNFKRVDQAKK
jgi:hypothetical protein